MINQVLAYLLPLFLLINLIIFLCILSYSIKIRPLFKVNLHELNYKKGLSFFLVLILVFLIAHFLPHRTNRIFYDEHIYMMIAQNISETGKALMGNHISFLYDDFRLLATQLNKEPNTWPFFLSFFFKIFGTNQFWGHILNNSALVLGCVFIFLILHNYTRNSVISLLGALIHFTIPHNIIWSNTCAVEPLASTLAIISVFITSSYLRRPENLKLYLLSSMLVFATQVRHECFLIIFVISLMLLINNFKVVKNKHTWYSAILFLALSIPHFIHLLIFKNHSWGSEGPKFSTSYIWNNLTTNSIYYINNLEFPIFVSIMVIISIFFSRTAGKNKYPIILWFFLMWGIFIPFHAGSYKYGADVRFAVLSFGPVSILAALGIQVLYDFFKKRNFNFIKLSTIVILLQFVIFLPQIKRIGQEAWASRYDSKYAKDFCSLIPANALVLTHNPSLFSLNGISAAQMSILTNNPKIQHDLFNQYEGGIYVHWNYWCNIINKSHKSYTENILNKFENKTIAEYKFQTMKYALYKIENPNQ